MFPFAICAIFRDEAPNLAEWMAFHRGVGVDRFFLYDDRSTDDPHAVLRPWIDEGVAVVHSWPVDAGQLSAYAHCLRHHGHEARRIAFIDIDEFLFSPVTQDVREVLAEYEDAPGLGVNWVTFGSAGHQRRPEGGVLENFALRGELEAVVPYPHLLRSAGADPSDPASYRPLNAHVKSIVDPRAVAAPATPHHFTFRDGRHAVDTLRRPLSGPFTESVSVDVLRINHYWSKSVEECRAKFARGCAAALRHRGWEEFDMRDAVTNDVRDEGILARRPDTAAAVVRRPAAAPEATAAAGMTLEDFAPDAETGVLVPKGDRAPAGYLDGAERYLLEGLQAIGDRSVGSEELRGLVRDWPSLYHLTPYRSTIFDCLGLTGRPRVLELGAGCGAITRWLGENCGEVHAIEGNAERARVARARSADLDNVHIYCTNYSQLDVAGEFDLVTLIGVLEYGHLYHPEFGGDPWRSAVDNLGVARRALADDGVLVLAIENKLGLKYFNGAREDHSGRVFESVQGYAHARSAVTFSAHEIERQLAEAGFAGSRFLVPFPDYKLATTIVDPDAARDEHHIHNWMTALPPDRGSADRTAFYNEALATRELARAGLLRDLANSFLVLAYAGDRDAAHQRLGIEDGWVARHYSLDRRPGMRKRVTLSGGDAPVARHEPALRDAPLERSGPLRQRLADEPFARGDLVLFEVFEAMASDRFDVHFGAAVRELRDWLLARYGTGQVDEAETPLLHGAAWDAAWWNLVRDAETGELRHIDLEWTFEVPVPVDYVLWRALFQIPRRWGGLLPKPWRDLDPQRFAARWLGQVLPRRSDERLAWLLRVEDAAWQAVASSASQPPSSALGALRHGRRVAVVRVAASDLLADTDLLSAYAEEFGATDDVTLLIATDAEDRARQVEALTALVASLGRPEEDLPDMLVGAHDEAVGAGAAVLTRLADVRALRRRLVEAR